MVTIKRRKVNKPKIKVRKKPKGFKDLKKPRVTARTIKLSSGRGKICHQ